MIPRHLIVFDMDGVIVDVSASYRDVVRQAARLFFRRAAAWEALPDPLFSLVDLAVVKQSGGLNNDWDLCAEVVGLLLGLAEVPAAKVSAGGWDLWEEVMARSDVSRLADFLKRTERPLTTLWREARKGAGPLISAFYAGDVGSGNVIKQIFQEIYLGRDLFVSTYRRAPRLYQADGFIHKETLLVDPKLLADLSQRHILAIATGRPAREADFPLDHFGIQKYFARMMTLDDCLAEERRLQREEGRNLSLSKPHPFMIDAVAAELRGQGARCYYIGDMPDDMAAAAASAAGFIGVGITVAAPDKADSRRRLAAAGAEYIVEGWEELQSVVEQTR